MVWVSTRSREEALNVIPILVALRMLMASSVSCLGMSQYMHTEGFATREYYSLAHVDITRRMERHGAVGLAL
jgi:hypothetical protein